MQEVINDFIILMKAIGAWLSSNRDSIISGIVATVILGIVVRVVSYVIKKPKELNELLKSVKAFNKQQAIWLVSEGILDLNFVKNPKTDIMSIRLGRCLQSK